MGAALHLAHAHQPPAPPKRKRGGSGGSGGNGCDALIARVYRDTRMTPKSRELIPLLAWLIMRDPGRYDAEGHWVSTWTRASDVLGVRKPGFRGKPRLAELVSEDCPRYEPDPQPGQEYVCQAPMIRRVGVCG